MPIDLKTLTIKKAHDALAKGEYSAVDLAEAYLSEIEKKNKELNAYLEVFADVREQAKEADRRTQSGAADTLTGIPIAIKDNILIEGRHAGAGSKILEGYRASYDATAIRKLKERGVVFLGRTNMDEFAMGSSTENSAFGVTRNPHDLSRVPGGSSGGSAAAVAAHLALAALGSDTGGSIRQPAAFCGVVGLKPTYGRVSRYGLIAMSSSLDVIGPFAKSIEDAEILFEAIAGRDPMDSTSIEPPTIINQQPTTNNQQLTTHDRRPTARFRIGVPKAVYELGGLDKDVRAHFEASLEKVAQRGAEILTIELPSLKYALPVYYIIMPAEASTNLARFDGVKYGFHAGSDTLLGEYLATRGRGFGREVRRRILLGTYVLSSGYYDAYYGKAVALRAKIQEELRGAFASSSAVDVIATPTTPTPAFEIGEKTSDPLSMYLADIFTVTANIAGVPALSFPSGVVKRNGKQVPLGMQLMGAHGREDFLFAAGKHFVS